MLRLVLLLITLVAVANAGEGYKKKMFMKYAMGNLFEKCMGQEVIDEFYKKWVKAAKTCHSREFDPDLKPVYIRAYPSPTKMEKKPYKSDYYQQPNMGYNNQPYYNQPPMPPMYQQPQMYRQPPMYKQPFSGYQQQNPSNQLYSRQTRDVNDVEENSIEGEAELYYYHKMKKMFHNKVGNMTCMMQECGYFTEDNKPNIEKYKEEYNTLTTVPDAMKKEFIDNIDLCHEVSECMPDSVFNKYPYGREYGRSFFFVKCEKKKAMEVCLKKQMVDDYYKYKEMFKDEDLSELEDMEDNDDMFTMGF